MRVFVATEGRSPVEAPSGPAPDGAPAGYLAMVYTCAERIDADGKTLDDLEAAGGGIAMVSRYLPEAAAAQVELHEGSFSDTDPKLYELMSTIRNGREVADPRSLDWVSADSAAAFALRTAAKDRCREGRPREIVPSR